MSAVKRPDEKRENSSSLQALIMFTTKVFLDLSQLPQEAPLSPEHQELLENLFSCLSTHPAKRLIRCFQPDKSRPLVAVLPLLMRYTLGRPLLMRLLHQWDQEEDKTNLNLFVECNILLSYLAISTPGRTTSNARPKVPALRLLLNNPAEQDFLLLIKLLKQSWMLALKQNQEPLRANMIEHIVLAFCTPSPHPCLNLPLHNDSSADFGETAFYDFLCRVNELIPKIPNLEELLEDLYPMFLHQRFIEAIQRFIHLTYRNHFAFHYTAFLCRSTLGQALLEQLIPKISMMPWVVLPHEGEFQAAPLAVCPEPLEAQAEPDTVQVAYVAQLFQPIQDALTSPSPDSTPVTVLSYLYTNKQRDYFYSPLLSRILQGRPAAVIWMRTQFLSLANLNDFLPFFNSPMGKEVLTYLLAQEGGVDWLIDHPQLKSLFESVCQFKREETQAFWNDKLSNIAAKKAFTILLKNLQNPNTMLTNLDEKYAKRLEAEDCKPEIKARIHHAVIAQDRADRNYNHCKALLSTHCERTFQVLLKPIEPHDDTPLFCRLVQHEISFKALYRFILLLPLDDIQLKAFVTSRVLFSFVAAPENPSLRLPLLYYFISTTDSQNTIESKISFLFYLLTCHMMVLNPHHNHDSVETRESITAFAQAMLTPFQTQADEPPLCIFQTLLNYLAVHAEQINRYPTLFQASYSFFFHPLFIEALRSSDLYSPHSRHLSLGQRPYSCGLSITELLTNLSSVRHPYFGSTLISMVDERQQLSSEMLATKKLAGSSAQEARRPLFQATQLVAARVAIPPPRRTATVILDQQQLQLPHNDAKSDPAALLP